MFRHEIYIVYCLNYTWIYKHSVGVWLLVIALFRTSENELGDLYLPMIVEMNTSLVDVADKTLLTHVGEDLDLENAVYNN